MTSNLRVFATALQKAHEWLKQIGEKYEWNQEHMDYSYDALRIVLHALRDRLTIDQTAAFAAQLPMLVRGFFYEGWEPHKVPIKMNKDEFIDYIASRIDFSFEGTLHELVRHVFLVVRQNIEPSEMDKLAKVLPEEIGDLLRSE